MDEKSLNELLECSVCLERLDHTSKVLPCQHTFCRRCLEEIVCTKHELRCPECRTLVVIRVEDLPTNILLIRLLEGIKYANMGTRPMLRHESAPATPIRQPKQPTASQSTGGGQLCARALFTFEGILSGDLSFKKGDLITGCKKLDENWYHGEFGGNQGCFPANYIQVMAPQPSATPQCKALYDFNMKDETEKDFLIFQKDEIVTVIRKVDDNWLEGRKSDKIGIFPISFVELNDAAKTLINLKFSKSSAGATTDGLSLPSSPPQNPSVVAIQLPQQKRHSLTLSSQSSTSPPVLNRRSLELSSVSLPVTTNVPDLMSFPPLNSDSGVTTTATTSATKTTSSTDQVGGAALVTSVSPAAVTSTSPSVAPSSAEGATAITSPVPAIPPSCTTPPYVAMYNYKPQKEDEVELRKGDYYSVSEKCQDGWFKGQCLKNGNSGVFPGNYVQIVRPSSALKAASSNVLNIRAKLPTTATTAVTTTATCATSVTSPSVTTTNAGASVVLPAPVTIKSLAENEASAIQPPSAASPPIAFTKQTAPPLAPRASRLPLPPPPPAAHLITTSPPIVHSRPKSQIQSSSSGPSSVVYSRPSSSHLSQLSILSNNGKTVHVPAGVKKSLVSRGTSVQQSVNTTILPPNVVIGATGSQPLLPASREKKEKKDKEKLSLVKRLTAGKIRKSKLSESEIGSTSDGTVVHIRSGSFPSVISGDSSPGSSTPEIGMHKKTGSLDATAQVKSKTSKPGLRERFRCIVPYPPQSDMELELKLGDVVFVYKKRDDGWYKGTLQRSGKTGHFPGSFVEKCD